VTLDPTRLVLARHGHTAANGSPAGMRMSGWTDTPLSDEGHREAMLLARAMAELRPFAALYTSTLLRARQTAAPIEAALGIEARLCPDLREINCGALDGRSVEHVRRDYPAEWARNEQQVDEGFRWPGGESYREFRARCLRAMGAISARHPGARVLVVTHAGFVSQILGSVGGVSCARWSSFRPGNASLSTVDWDPARRAVVTFDERSHIVPAPSPDHVASARRMIRSHSRTAHAVRARAARGVSGRLATSS
jgi:broad specificity phosphatase PhoE